MRGSIRLACLRGALVAAVAAVGVALVALPLGAPAAAASTGGCGPETQTVITADYESTTRTIYGDELSSPRVAQDLGHVTSATDLASAVAGDDAAATVAATTRIVYTPVWHIVRLRVVSSSGRVLADIGGPDVLAPVTGKITYHGAVVGSFVMSVQDDLGYEKLVTRFTALPIELYRGGKPLMGRDFPAAQVPASLPPDGTLINVAGTKAVTLSYPVNAFPSGRVDVLLAVPRANAELALASCAEVNAQAFGAISLHIARLINLVNAPSTYVMLSHEFDPKALTFLRDGANQLGGSEDLPGPANIPDSGSVTYQGETWLVYSFEARRGVRVYVLFPDTPPSAVAPSEGSS